MSYPILFLFLFYCDFNGELIRNCD